MTLAALVLSDPPRLLHDAALCGAINAGLAPEQTVVTMQTHGAFGRVFATHVRTDYRDCRALTLREQADCREALLASGHYHERAGRIVSTWNEAANDG